MTTATDSFTAQPRRDPLIPLVCPARIPRRKLDARALRTHRNVCGAWHRRPVHRVSGRRPGKGVGCFARKHRRQGDLQYPADIEQADRADAIDAALVILDLLKRDTQRPGKLFLT